jgi:hypothetical protein
LALAFMIVSPARTAIKPNSRASLSNSSKSHPFL